MEFISGSINTISIVGINNENQSLCILIVVSPQRSDLILSSYIPHSEANILVLNSLDVETNGRNGSDNFTQFKLVQDSGLSCGIQTHHKDSHLFLPKHSFPYSTEVKSHGQHSGVGGTSNVSRNSSNMTPSAS